MLDIYKTPRYGGGELMSLGTAECTNAGKLIALLESENYRDSIHIDQHLERVILDILNLFYRSDFGFAKIKLIIHDHTQEKPGKHLAGDILLSQMDFLEKECKRKKKPWSKFKGLLKKVKANLKGKRQQKLRCKGLAGRLRRESGLGCSTCLALSLILELPTTSVSDLVLRWNGVHGEHPMYTALRVGITIMCTAMPLRFGV
jgi:hypothetical protein